MSSAAPASDPGVPLSVSSKVLTVLLFRRYRKVWTTILYLGSMTLMALPFNLYHLWRSRPLVFRQFLCHLSLYLGEGCTLRHAAAQDCIQLGAPTWQSSARPL